LRRISSDEPEPLVGVAATAPALAALVLACMAKNAGDRPANAAEWSRSSTQ